MWRRDFTFDCFHLRSNPSTFPAFPCNRVGASSVLSNSFKKAELILKIWYRTDSKKLINHNLMWSSNLRSSRERFSTSACQTTRWSLNHPESTKVVVFLHFWFFLFCFVLFFCFISWLILHNEQEIMWWFS